MGKRTTTSGYWRAHGDTKKLSTPAVMPCVLAATGLDATLAAAGILTGKKLPIGAIPLRVDIVGGGTGGTSPLVDVGLELATPDDNGLVDGAAVDSNSSNGIGGSEAGALLGTVLTEAAEITVSDGGGTNATGGTFDIYVYYTFDDDGTTND